MDIKILKEKETALLSRKRITTEIHFDGATPKKDQIKQGIADKLKCDVNNVEVRHVYTAFGERKAKAIANIYDDPKVMTKVVKKGKTVKKAKTNG